MALVVFEEMSSIVLAVPDPSDGLDLYMEYYEGFAKILQGYVGKLEANPNQEAVDQLSNMLTKAKEARSAKINYLKNNNATAAEVAAATEILDEYIKPCNDLMTKIVVTQNNMTGAAASIEQLMNGDTYQKMKNLEQKIVFKKFYFPGNDVVLKVTDNPDSLSKWDPRYIQDYVEQAKQNGWYRWFVYYRPATNTTEGGWKPMSTTDAEKELSYYIDIDGMPFDKKDQWGLEYVASILASLVYFDKLKILTDKYSYYFEPDTLINAVGNYTSLMYKYLEKLIGLIGQDSDEFIREDRGWMANSNYLAFDSEYDAMELAALEKEYNEYKAQIWEILKNLNVLQLCTNITEVTGINVEVSQVATCVQQIGDTAETTELEDFGYLDDTGVEHNKEDIIRDVLDKARAEEDKTEDLYSQLEDLRKQMEQPIEQDNSSLIVAVVIIAVVIVVGFGAMIAIMLTRGNKSSKKKKSSSSKKTVE